MTAISEVYGIIKYEIYEEVTMKKEKCPYCGNDKFVEGKQEGYGAVGPANKTWTFKSQKLYHKICLNCGAVVKSYVEKPSKIMIKKEEQN